MSSSPNVAKRKPKVGSRIVAMALAGAVLGSGGVALQAMAPQSAFVQSAHAVSTGPGKWDGAGAGLGAFRHSNGTLVYCSELGQTVDQSNSPGMDRTGTLGAYNSQMYMIHGNTFNNVGVGAISGDRLQQINYILHQWGQTGDNTRAAAVQLAIWKIRAEVGATSGYNAALNYMINYAGSSANSRANEMVNQAKSNAGDVQQGTGTTPQGLELAETGAYQGTLTVHEGTTSVTLTNAVFADTGLSTREWPNGLDRTATLNWIGQPPADDWADKYTVTVRGTYEYERGSSYWPSAVNEGDAGTGPSGSWQNMVSGIGPVDDFETITGDFSAKYADPSTVWAPELTSQVPSEFIDKGESFADTITFDVADDSNEWRYYRADGQIRYAPITAQGTLYGPFTSNPEDNASETPPADAPVAATAEITTTPEQGPGDYTVDTADAVSTESGYYSWVWEIDGADQIDSLINPEGGNSSLQDGVDYYFTDGFGTVNETHITTLDIELLTQLDRNEAAPGNTIEDTITATADGEMFVDADGNQVPVHLDGTMYYLPEAVEQTGDIPADAEIVGTYDAVIEDIDQPVVAGDLILPKEEGWITMVWCVDTEESPLYSAYCDDFGVPSESAELAFPEVVTQATNEVPVFDTAYDIAYVDGEVPAGSQLTFELFSKVAVGEPKYDADGNLVKDEDGNIQFWTQEDYDALVADSGLIVGEPKLDDNGEAVVDADGNPVLITDEDIAQAVCTASPIFNTADNPIAVDGPGEYQSESYATQHIGTLYWVETLEFPEDPENPDGDVQYHVGECGIPNETTTVTVPDVTTKAQETGTAGETIQDTAIVDGDITGNESIVTEVVFEVFKQDLTHTPKMEDGVDTAAVCTPDTSYAVTEAVTVTESGEYDSPEVGTEVGDGGIYYWIETLQWENTETGETGVLHVGDCGLPNERTDVTEPLAAPAATNTNSEINWVPVAGLGALMLLGGAVALLIVLRRKGA